ncbi:MAG: nuclear transport factor 2 family protein [Planctomycetia bacterium]|nr:nuclear transport factor 2 family protein [Planctomycetia bacterium]
MSSPSVEQQNLATAHRFLEALERFDPPEAIRPFLDPAIEQHEFPNRLVTRGQKRGLAAMLEGARRAPHVLSAQRYEVRNAVARGDHVALEVVWTGKLAAAFGELTAGSELKAYLAIFLEFRDGRIVAQRNYDCYEPW